MDYELFKKKILESIEEVLPPEFHNCVAKIEKVMKTNVKKDALFMLPLPSNKNTFMSPLIYLDDMYEEYLEMKDFYPILMRIAVMLESNTRMIDLNEMRERLINETDKIVPCLINTELNQEFLKAAPHRQYHDMSIIYRFCWMRNGQPQYESVAITNQILAEIGMSEAELYELAYENRKRMFPPQISDLFVYHVVTCKELVYGATSIIYPEVLQELKDRIKGSFYLMPSSIYEFLAVPADSITEVSNLLDILKNGNETVVSPSEILSSSIYLCDGVKIIQIYR